MSENQELELSQPEINPEINPLSIIDKAISSNIDAANLTSLMDLQERYEANNAKKSFSFAMAEFQSQCPIIKKTRKGHNCTYASYDDIMREVKPILDTNGLSILWTENNILNGELTLHGMICHKSGHSVSISGKTSVDSKMSANDTQKIGSAISYCKRYTLCAALNIVVSDEDDDATLAGTDIIDSEKVEAIRNLIKETGADEKKLLAFAGVPSLELIPITKYNSIIKSFNKKVQKNEGN